MLAVVFEEFEVEVGYIFLHLFSFDNWLKINFSKNLGELQPPRPPPPAPRPRPVSTGLLKIICLLYSISIFFMRVTEEKNLV